MENIKANVESFYQGVDYWNDQDPNDRVVDFGSFPEDFDLMDLQEVIKFNHHQAELEFLNGYQLDYFGLKEIGQGYRERGEIKQGNEFLKGFRYAQSRDFTQQFLDYTDILGEV